MAQLTKQDIDNAKVTWVTIVSWRGVLCISIYIQGHQAFNKGLCNGKKKDFVFTA